jgi:hypothetical protein
MVVFDGVHCHRLHGRKGFKAVVVRQNMNKSVRALAMALSIPIVAATTTCSPATTPVTPPSETATITLEATQTPTQPRTLDDDLRLFHEYTPRFTFDKVVELDPLRYVNTIAQSMSSRESAPYHRTLRQLFAVAHIDPRLESIAITESEGNPLARSKAGAEGMFQVAHGHNETFTNVLKKYNVSYDYRDMFQQARAAASILNVNTKITGSPLLSTTQYNTANNVRHAINDGIRIAALQQIRHPERQYSLINFLLGRKAARAVCDADIHVQSMNGSERVPLTQFCIDSDEYMEKTVANIAVVERLFHTVPQTSVHAYQLHTSADLHSLSARYKIPLSTLQALNPRARADNKLARNALFYVPRIVTDTALTPAPWLFETASPCAVWTEWDSYHFPQRQSGETSATWQRRVVEHNQHVVRIANDFGACGEWYMEAAIKSVGTMSLQWDPIERRYANNAQRRTIVARFATESPSLPYLRRALSR